MIQDIYKNARPLHLGVGLLAILALLSAAPPTTPCRKTRQGHSYNPYST